MVPVGNGHFCGNCQQVVIDYSQMSDQEIVRTLRAHGAQSCGFFRPDQLNRAMVASQPPKQWNWRQWVGVISLGVLSWQESKAQANPWANSTAMITKHADVTPASIPVQKRFSSTDKRLITGRVLTIGLDKTLQPASQVQVVVSDQFANITVQTDSVGLFQAELPLVDFNRSLLNDSQRLRINVFAPDYLIASSVYEISPSTLPFEIKDIFLRRIPERKTIVGGGITTVCTPKLNASVPNNSASGFWKRLWHKRSH